MQHLHFPALLPLPANGTGEFTVFALQQFQQKYLELKSVGSCGVYHKRSPFKSNCCLNELQGFTWYLVQMRCHALFSVPTMAEFLRKTFFPVFKSAHCSICSPDI